MAEETNSAHFRVTSHNRSLDEIGRAARSAPDESWVAGSLNPQTSRTREFSALRFEAGSSTTLSDQLPDLYRRVESLRGALAGITDSQTFAGLEIVQRSTRREELVLSSDWVLLLADIAGWMDVDQYFDFDDQHVGHAPRRHPISVELNHHVKVPFRVETVVGPTNMSDVLRGVITSRRTSLGDENLTSVAVRQDANSLLEAGLHFESDWFDFLSREHCALELSLGTLGTPPRRGSM
jgi:hypothetical protein